MLSESDTESRTIFKKVDYECVLTMLNNPSSKVKGFERFQKQIREYMQLVSYNGEGIKNFQQIANYQARTLNTNYNVNVQEHFIQKVKTFCSLLIVKKLKSNIPDGTTAKKHTKLLQSRNRHAQQCIFTTEKKDFDLMMKEVNGYDERIIQLIKRVLPSNPSTKGIHYDLASRPLEYVETYLKLGGLYEEYGLKTFNVFPLSTSIVPRHITIDTKILCLHILGIKSTELKISETKTEVWSSVFKLKNKAFRSRSGMDFNGLIRTDGVSASVVIQQKKKTFWW